jgi:endonuclease III
MGTLLSTYEDTPQYAYESAKRKRRTSSSVGTNSRTKRVRRSRKNDEAARVDDWDTDHRDGHDENFSSKTRRSKRKPPLNVPTETSPSSPRVRTKIDDAPSSVPKRQRKRRSSSSPYFEQSQLPTPRETPTPIRTVQVQKSKVSVLESNSLPSLPHFPPTSHDDFGLIQEKLRYEPWKMLVAVIFLNVTTAKMALPLLAQLFERWPCPEALANGRSQGDCTDIANFDELVQFLWPIGLYNTRARRLIDFSAMWLTHPPRPDVLMKRKGLGKYPPTAISHLPGVRSQRSFG